MARKKLRNEGGRRKIWDLLKTCADDNRYFNSYDDKESRNVQRFIDHIRNSVSHSGKLGLHFYPVVKGGDSNITHIIFYDSDYKDMSEAIRKWNSDLRYVQGINVYSLKRYKVDRVYRIEK